MRRPRKYQKGELLSWAEFKGLYDLARDNPTLPIFVWLKGRAEHITVTAERPSIWRDFMVDNEHVYHAVVTDEYREWVAKEAREAFPSEGPVPMEDAA